MPGSASTPVLPLDLEVREPALGGEVGELRRARVHPRDHRAPDREGDDEEPAETSVTRARPGRDQVDHVT